jgi:hypothetical protein
LSPTTGDILFAYDNTGNRVERIIYFSSPRNTRNAMQEEETAISEELNSNIIRIYPNPTEGILRIEITGYKDETNGTIRLYSSSGNPVYNNSINGTITDIDLTEQVSGIYVLIIAVNNETSTWKIVKE